MIRLLVIGYVAAVVVLLSPEARAAVEPSCADWYASGFTDGEQHGSPADATSRIEEHAAQCGAPRDVDRAAYEQGFELGLREFCTPARGFAYARSGQTYAGWCPEDLADGFAQGYADGLRVHDVEHVLSEARFAERRLREIRTDARNDVDRARIERAVAPLYARTQGGGRAAADRRDYAFMEQTSDLGRIERHLMTIQGVLPEIEEQLSELRTEIGDRYGEW